MDDAEDTTDGIIPSQFQFHPAFTLPVNDYLSMNAKAEKGMPPGHPFFSFRLNHTPAAIRTRDLQLRRLTLYPAELRVRARVKIHQALRWVNLRNSAIA